MSVNVCFGGLVLVGRHTQTHTHTHMIVCVCNAEHYQRTMIITTDVSPLCFQHKVLWLSYTHGRKLNKEKGIDGLAIHLCLSNQPLTARPGNGRWALCQMV